MTDPATKPDLQALLVRVEKATGPDRVLNGDILWAFGWSAPDGVVLDHDGQRAMQIPDVTASIDSALALVERVLPGSRKALIEQDGGWGAMVLVFAGEQWDCPGETYAPTPALALVSALLKALESRP